MLYMDIFLLVQQNLHKWSVVIFGAWLWYNYLPLVEIKWVGNLAGSLKLTFCYWFSECLTHIDMYSCTYVSQVSRPCSQSGRSNQKFMVIFYSTLKCVRVLIFTKSGLICFTLEAVKKDIIRKSCFKNSLRLIRFNRVLF